MHGDAMLFVREDAVEAAWAIVDPILASATNLYSYEPGSWGPREADGLATDVDGWHNPEERKESTVHVPNSCMPRRDSSRALLDCQGEIQERPADCDEATETRGVGHELPDTPPRL